MQKKILALAVAGLVSSAAFAESNVSIYGIVDAGFASVKNNNGVTSTSTKRIDGGLLSSSRLGFKGTEDLGGGTSALFVLEYALANDQATGQTAAGGGNGSGIGAARQQLVGLKGSFGTVVAGRANTLGASFYNGGYNAFFGTQLDSYAQIGVTGNAAARGTQNYLIGAGARANNAFGYISPSFSGVTLGLNYALNPTGTEAAPAAGADQATAVLFSVDYANGPIKVGYVNATHDDGTTNANAKTKEDGIGVSYDMKVVKLGFSHLTNKRDGGSKNKGYQISVSAPVGAGTVLGQYASYAPGSVAGVAQAKDNGFALAYLHPMSKRTTAYAGYEAANNKTTGAATAKQTTIAVGIRHKF